MFYSCLIFFSFVFSAFTYDLSFVSFTILSQPHKLHERIAEKSKDTLLATLKASGVSSPQVHLLHQDFSQHGAWTIFPLLPTLNEISMPDTKWFFFLHESAVVNAESLKKVLSKFKSDYEIFVGSSLIDKDSTIIHHFDPSGLAYPDFKAGFLLSKQLLNSLAKRFDENPDNLEGFPHDFSIDASYELAKVISKLHQNGPRLDHEPLLCTSQAANCAVYPKETSCQSNTESIRDLAKQTLIAVKTCGKFHEERLSVVRDTWGPAAVNKIVVSEVEDPAFGTVVLPGIEFNTNSGHCQKTESIVKYFNINAGKNDWKWLVIVDDDTILSVAKLLELLHCYDDPDDLIAIGQKYGFRVSRGSYGYDYPTGGSGMIFNRKLIERMMNLTETHCKCLKPDQPDDMHLGACLANLGVSLIHSERLHQARPEDYPQSLLQHQDPISFHKFWNTDPRKVYDTWFRSADEDLKLFNFNLKHRHQEL